MTSHPLQAEMNRLAHIRKDFETEEQYISYVKDTLNTLKKFSVINDWYLHMTDGGMHIYAQAVKTCYELVFSYVSR